MNSIISLLFNSEYCTSEKNKEKELARIQDIQRKMRFRRFNNFVRIIQRNPNVYWPAVFRLISRHEDIALIIYSNDYAERFLTTLLEYGCDDLNVVKRILELYSLCDNLSISGENSSSSFIKYIMFLNLLSIPLGSEDVAGSVLFCSEMTVVALRSLDFNFLRVLVKYGLFDEREINFSQMCKESMQHFWNDIEILGNVSLNSGNSYCRGARRIVSVINIIRILKFDRIHLKHLNYFKTYIRATAEPLITKEDIIEVLHLHFNGIPECVLANLVQDYERYFPVECVTDYEPRTLKHLCRVRIRRHFVDRGNGVVLPKAVERLLLPKKLQNYLLCLS